MNPPSTAASSALGSTPATQAHFAGYPARRDKYEGTGMLYNQDPWSPYAQNHGHDRLESSLTYPRPLQHPPGLAARNRSHTFHPSSTNTMATTLIDEQRGSTSSQPRVGATYPSPYRPSADLAPQAYSQFEPDMRSLHLDSDLPGSGRSWASPVLRGSPIDSFRADSSPMDAYNTPDMASNSSGQWPKAYQQRRPSNRDEFDGPSQFLPKNDAAYGEPREEDLPGLPTHLGAQEQDDILTQVSQRLCQCAFDFVAKYQFPVPIEPDKRPVRVATDREWAEWVHLLKRLATKRRIPTRVLYNGQIRQLTTILESSLDMRPSVRHQSRPPKDDRNVLQLISSGLQVAKILKDGQAMRHLDSIYTSVEGLIESRRAQAAAFAFDSV